MKEEGQPSSSSFAKKLDVSRLISSPKFRKSSQKPTNNVLLLSQKSHTYVV